MPTIYSAFYNLLNHNRYAAFHTVQLLYRVSTLLIATYVKNDQKYT